MDGDCCKDVFFQLGGKWKLKLVRNVYCVQQEGFNRGNK